MPIEVVKAAPKPKEPEQLREYQIRMRIARVSEFTPEFEATLKSIGITNGTFSVISDEPSLKAELGFKWPGKSANSAARDAKFALQKAGISAG